MSLEREVTRKLYKPLAFVIFRYTSPRLVFTNLGFFKMGVAIFIDGNASTNLKMNCDKSIMLKKEILDNFFNN